jgi:hypothetical protein
MTDRVRVACAVWLSLSLFGCKASDEAPQQSDDAGMHSPQAGHSGAGLSGGQGAAAHGGSGNPSGQGGMGFPQAGNQGLPPGAGTGGMASRPHARVTFQLKGVQ